MAKSGFQGKVSNRGNTVSFGNKKGVPKFFDNKSNPFPFKNNKPK